MPTVYLDVSCLNRAFDDQTQPRVRLEAEALTVIFEMFEAGDLQHVSSGMAEVELGATSDFDRRERVRLLLPDAGRILPLTQPVFERARELEKLRMKPADAVHVAAAEAAGADVMLTCDDRLVRTAKRNSDKLLVRVENPLVWLKEVRP